MVMTANPKRRPYQADSLRGAVLVRLGMFAGRVSRAWGQRALGTFFATLDRVGASRGERCRVEFIPGKWFELEVCEPYWAPTIIGGRPYERELGHILDRLKHHRAAFVDGGANYGYWSLVASSEALGYAPVIAIEANPKTYARLARNSELNGGTITTFNNALSDRTGESIRIHVSEFHAVSHVEQVAEAGTVVDVPTITVDDAIERAGASRHEAFVIKLDVEGWELPTLRGCRRVREAHDCAIIFEDWPDKGLPIVAHLLSEGDSVFYIRQDASCLAVTDVASGQRAVRGDSRRDHGANFVAVNRKDALLSTFAKWTAERSANERA